MNKRRPTSTSLSIIGPRPITITRWALFILFVLMLSACAGEGGSDGESAGSGMETSGSAAATTSDEGDGADMAEAGEESQEAIVSGIEGRAVIGPTCPAQRVDEPCPQRPYPTTLTIVNPSTDETVTTVECDEEGYFHVELPPGTYRLEPPEAQVVTAPRAKPMTVDVKAGEYTEIVMRFDSGMR